MRLPSGAHLTYCTNIHPGETWDEVREALARHLPAIAARSAAGASFGVGLRLSARSAQTLEHDERAFAELIAVLSRVGGYVPTINGFPYGEFHRGPVKEAVYEPDWHQASRVDYTLCLARLAARLARALPGGPECPSISTVPGCFRRSVRAGSLERMGQKLREVAAGLGRIEDETGVRVTVGLEPEPACLLETTTEAVTFLETHVHAGAEVSRVELARRHIGLCLDTCHAAVGFESASETVALLRRHEVLVTKIQVTSALELEIATEERLADLRRFADDTYLHQVSVRTPAGVRRFLDLPEALADDALVGQPWRVHFHVPVSEERMGSLSTTRPFLEEILAAQKAQALTDQLEVETYTYDVLPSDLRDRTVDDVICRELEWTRRALGA